MWLECIRYRFQLDPEQDCLELAQTAALRSLRHSPRCRSWRVLPSPHDPSLSVLEIEWDAGPTLAPFRGSEEFAALHAALTEQVRALDEADYTANARLVRRALGGPDALFRLAEDIVARVMREPELAWRFHSKDGARRARLGLWLLEVLGGPDLFSSSFPGAARNQGPLVGDVLDLDERERFLEVASECLPNGADDNAAGALGALRAHLPLYPEPQSLDGGEELMLDDELLVGGELLLDEGLMLDDSQVPRSLLGAGSEALDGAAEADAAHSGPYAASDGAPRAASRDPEAPPSRPHTRTSPGLGPFPPRDASAPPALPRAMVTRERTREPGGVGPGGVGPGGLKPGMTGSDDAATDAAAPDTAERSSSSRRRIGRRYRVFDSGVFPQQGRRQTAKR